VKQLVERFNIEAIGIGNGTAGRENRTICAKDRFWPEDQRLPGQRKRRFYLLRIRSGKGRISGS
jgi:hypothetical protein